MLLEVPPLELVPLEVPRQLESVQWLLFHLAHDDNCDEHLSTMDLDLRSMDLQLVHVALEMPVVGPSKVVVLMVFEGLWYPRQEAHLVVVLVVPAVLPAVVAPMVVVVVPVMAVALEEHASAQYQVVVQSVEEHWQ